MALQGLIMMVTGLALIAASAVLIVASDDDSPTALGVIGIVFVAVGARQRRHALRRH